VKAAIYARYSSDNQRDASIADQLRISREFAGRQGWTIVDEFTGHAISGATLLRAGFQALMRDALNQRFDVVLAEALDRFSRDQEDTAGLFKRLTFAGVNIVTLADPDVTVNVPLAPTTAFAKHVIAPCVPVVRLVVFSGYGSGSCAPTVVTGHPTCT
jgi:DNA invertase Pin-like site-specific DNA recombinase